MLTYATKQLTPSGAAKPDPSSIKVLLVGDCIENFPRLKSLLRLFRHTVTLVETITELRQACQEFYEFVVVDVGPEHIVSILHEIRASTQLQNTAVLVRAERLVRTFERASVFAKARTVPDLDAERLAQEYGLTSVFTKYRARPGLDTELARLVSSRGQEKGAAGSSASSQQSVVL
jgi:hypothetical protein